MRRSEASSESSSVPMSKKSVVPAATQKPVRAKPMRGPGVEATGMANCVLQGGLPGGRTGEDNVSSPMTCAGAQTKLKKDFCTQMLLGGYVESFVDLFYLTHRNDTAATATRAGSSGSNDAAAKTMGSSSFEVSELEFLRDQLVTAEHCKRKGEIPEVLHAYDGLATYCREKNDIPTMIFFYDKCLEIARLVNDQTSEMHYVTIAQVVYEHEDDDELRGDAYRDLGKVYVDLAMQHELAKQYLDCASKAGDKDCIAHAQCKIGACYNALGQPANALPFLEAYLTTCQKTGNVEGEGNACAELATAHDQLDNKQLSIDFLNHYIAIATKAENDFARAREMHEKNYELVPAVVAAQTKSAADKTAWNCSRVNVGAARANDKLAVFLTLVKDDFRGLLEWKNSHTIPSAG
ncbi:hypothetical protein FI667_g7897, partial [Globisporangium splendens]